jgi:hypothetical protein
MDRTSQGPILNKNLSATKSQANLTNNNFNKFSSSGYTNNAFLLMSGHHDFTQNDFNINQAETIDNSKNKSNSKTRPLQQYGGGMGGRFSNDNTIDRREQQRDRDNSNDIEESIIEEEINYDNRDRERRPISPGTPLITSKTKGKGKMELKLMKPPKPFGETGASPQEKMSIPFKHSKFDTINQSQKSAHLTEIPEQIG